VTSQVLWEKMNENLKNWLQDELKKVEDTYLIKATSMTGAYRREKSLSKEYNGRQLLELLQNADDEAEGATNPAVLIRLEPNRLIFANNGTPFSKSGIRSLIDSDNSPKIMNRKKIGYKGLGFRAILNWTHSLCIKSGGFSIEFSRAMANDFFKQLLDKKPDLMEEMQEQFGPEFNYNECPIAILSAPSWKESWDFGVSDYDTYIVMNFSSEQIRSDIQNQINDLGMEAALFLNNVKRIKIESPGRKQTIQKMPCDSKSFEEVRILDDSNEILQSKKWRIFPKTGGIPSEVQSESNGHYEYDIRIAVSEYFDDQINRLFSYFRTEIRFPFPAIIHGTFELDDSRNHLVKSSVNEFLLKELADLMISTAKTLTEMNKVVSWNAIKLLSKQGDFDDKIEEMGFYQNLLDKMRREKLIPIISNIYVSRRRTRIL
jgi:hypothetical protein